jgi:hypothetical protein
MILKSLNMKRLETLIFILIAFMVNAFSQQTNEITTMHAINDFSLTLREGKAPNRLPYTPYHVEKEWNALAGDDLNFPFHMASAVGVFPAKAGIYTVSLHTLTERDGECVYNVYVNDKPVGSAKKNPPTNEFCAPALLQWTAVEIPANAKIRVESNSYSNLKRHEASFFEYARGRWTAIDFKSEQNAKMLPSEPQDIGIFEKCITIGSVEILAKMNYQKSQQTYFLIGGGSGLKDKQDRFGYLYKSVTGDFIMEAGVKIIGLSDNRKSAAGLMMRQSADTDAAFIACLIQKDGAVTFQYRPAAGKTTNEIVLKVADAEMIQIEKKGESYTISAAKFGETYERNSVEISGFTGSLMIGFCVYSNSDKEKEAVSFSNVRFY